MKEKQVRATSPKKTVLAILGLAVGVVLMLFGSFGGPGGQEQAEREGGQSAESYRESVEQRLKVLCSSVRGAGEVRVYVSLGGGYETVYSLNERGECVTVGSGSGERAVVEQIRQPEIVGVGIVCPGAGDLSVRNTLCELVASALGIGINRIVIAEGY